MYKEVLMNDRYILFLESGDGLMNKYLFQMLSSFILTYLYFAIFQFDHIKLLLPIKIKQNHLLWNGLL